MDQPWMYMVLLGLVLLVYARMIPKSSGGAPKEGSIMNVNEMEEAMDHFAAELDEQNQALIAMFAETKKENELHHVRLSSRVEALEKQNAQLQQEVSRLAFAQEQMRGSFPAEPASAAVLPRGAELHAAGGDPAAALDPLELQALVPDEVEEPAPLPAPKNIKERYEELFRLYEQGKSTDAIAKKLGLNKGEIHLILQLAKQEEKTHA
ncbi:MULTISPECIES: hypothetical protein [Paenibacillus]|uniref:hypothetical protein n=1 Tax=Paenibacillus TaxID=44249 RepID=UPI0022B8EE9A|nr:hypothetical protein [Paenibacillus caseinilyticus]MCZ8520027.1 hypothetical protein [Paenibacillus caseinilyticus]